MIGHLSKVYSSAFYSEKVELKESLDEVFNEIMGRVSKIKDEYSLITFEGYAGFYWKFAEEGLNYLSKKLKEQGFKRVYIETFPYEYEEYKELRFGRFFLEF